MNVLAPISFPAQVYTHIDKAEFVDINVRALFVVEEPRRLGAACRLFTVAEVFKDREMINIEAIYEPPQRQGGVIVMACASFTIHEGQVERIAAAAGWSVWGGSSHLPQSELHVGGNTLCEIPNAQYCTDPLSGLRRPGS